MASAQASPASLHPSSTNSNDPPIQMGNDGVASQPRGSAPPRGGKKSKGNIVCKFYASPGGCRSGDSCPFLHPSENIPKQESSETHAVASREALVPTTIAESSSGAKEVSKPPAAGNSVGRKYVARQAPAVNIVVKPVPRAQVEDPRGFQIGQIRRRYSPTESSRDNGTSLSIKLIPSDPDFPFDIQALECVLFVPDKYPVNKPTLRVNNKEMGRGYQINVEKGFDDIVQRMTQGTLLHYMNALDKELEILLAAPKAETVVLVQNYGKARAVEPESSKPRESQAAEESRSGLISEHEKPIQPQVFTPQELEAALKKRESDTRQLEARLGRLPLFAKGSDGRSYTIPVEPRRRSELPQSLQAIKTVKLIVPEKYNLESCRIELPGLSGDAVAVLQKNFEAWANDNTANSLVAHINSLSQNTHTLAVATTTSKAMTTSTASLPAASASEPQPLQNPKDKLHGIAGDVDDRSHIKTIPRPPEWVMVDGDNASDTDDSFAYDSGDEDEDQEASEQEDKDLPTGPERGILVSFPYLELHGIELLELSSLCITVKCDRCKEAVDLANLKNNDTANNSAVRNVACKKCNNQLGIGYRMDLMHANSVRAGYLDLDACTVVDMLPSTFVPTCSGCSTPQKQGVVSVRGESTTAMCRECHKRMSFRIPEIKFLQVSAAVVRASRAPPRKKKEILGITAGQELPGRGKCSHYSKSYRWFRFSCCNKVFPCDKCHDNESDHPNEHANRMICGWCSREQNYRPEDCGVCHASLTAKKGSGFWEGGKGTRDKVKMSRKDPRKYKRRPGTKVGS